MKKTLFAITGVHYIEVLFHIFHYYWGRENRLLHGGLRYNRDLLYQDSTVADAEVLINIHCVSWLLLKSSNSKYGLPQLVMKN